MSTGPGWPPVWNREAPTPNGDVMAQATACWNGVMPSAAMIPPTLTAPVSYSVCTARRR